MKQKYVTLDKRSKQEQKAYYATQRKDWGTINPVTRKIENAKAYNRKKSKQRWHEFEPGLDFFVIQNKEQGYIFFTAILHGTLLESDL